MGAELWFNLRPSVGRIAQLVEQRTENPCVPGSIPGPATISIFFPEEFFFAGSWFAENSGTYQKMPIIRQ